MGRFLKWLGFAGFALVAVLLARYAGVFPLPFQFLAPPPPAAEKAAAWQGPVLPAVSLETLDGRAFNLAELQGRVMLINFWASWCPPCLEEFPLLFDLVGDFDGEVLLVAVTQDAHREDAVAFLRQFEAEHRAVLAGGNVVAAWDPTLEVAQKAFHVVRLPETFVVDRAGRIVRKVVGTEAWKGEEIGAWLRALVASPR